MLSPVPTLKRSARAAFTLLEIMIALAILGLLVGLAVTNLGNIFGEKQIEVAKIYVSSTMPLTFDTYRLSMGSYPSTNEGLQVLLTAPANAGSKWKGRPAIRGASSTSTPILGSTISAATTFGPRAPTRPMAPPTTSATGPRPLPPRRPSNFFGFVCPTAGPMFLGLKSPPGRGLRPGLD